MVRLLLLSLSPICISDISTSPTIWDSDTGDGEPSFGEKDHVTLGCGTPVAWHMKLKVTEFGSVTMASFGSTTKEGATV